MGAARVEETHKAVEVFLSFPPVLLSINLFWSNLTHYTE